MADKGMITTALLLAATLITVPLLAFKFDQPLSAMQIAMLKDVTLLMLGIAGLCFAVGEATRNVSQVDKLWSIVPVLYSWDLTVAGGYQPRMVLMSVLATIWGVRLTYNFSRHGGYSWKFWSGAEDYRWAHVRQNPGLNTAIGWTLFNLFFICLYQNALLLLIALPVLMVHDAPQALGPLDVLLAAAFVGLVILETIADQQQWNFQAEKKRRIAVGEKLNGRYATGFIHDGLWARSRHPNYFAEQSIWVVYFLFSVAATGRLNWSIAGCLLLILLFRGSSGLSESLQAEKYSAYGDYQRRVPRFLPKLF
jgi:steroid 5-alpha reductase family enzyme